MAEVQRNYPHTHHPASLDKKWALLFHYTILSLYLLFSSTPLSNDLSPLLRLVFPVIRSSLTFLFSLPLLASNSAPETSGPCYNREDLRVQICRMGARNRQRSMSAADTSPPPGILTSLPPFLPIRLLWTTPFAAFPPQVSQRMCLAGSGSRHGVSSPISAACGAGPHNLLIHVHLPLCSMHTSTHHGVLGDISEPSGPKHMTLTIVVGPTLSVASTRIRRAPARNESYPASIHNQHLYKDANGLKYGRSLLIFFIKVGDLSSSPNALV
ncbi:hypothetical protein LX32DRAFT_357214 [Colletotrichum zoysiae]|uniref:Uncharacterized protein n=1 Tax=Colletotrichum zoysiae TaxID=1216348 RepID=A0AAD9HIC7_9PEZI|nr:hypothetical protein LX32DRAFT_357214 [Colletotrichum zoysiae]